MKYLYNTGNKVCAHAIEVEIEGDTVVYVKFSGGCDGNHKGIEKLVEGMKIDDVIRRLSGVTCGCRNTSCPDQLACALTEAVKKLD